MVREWVRVGYGNGYGYGYGRRPWLTLYNVSTYIFPFPYPFPFYHSEPLSRSLTLSLFPSCFLISSLCMQEVFVIRYSRIVLKKGPASAGRSRQDSSCRWQSGQRTTDTRALRVCVCLFLLLVSAAVDEGSGCGVSCTAQRKKVALLVHFLKKKRRRRRRRKTHSFYGPSTYLTHSTKPTHSLA